MTAPPMDHPAFESVPGAVRRAVAAFFALQGLGVLLWWLVLALAPEARAHFRMGAAPDPTLLAFALPDLAVLAPGSLLGAWLVARRDGRAPLVLWAAAGASAYATLYCLAFALDTGLGWAGVAAMLPSALLSLGCAASASPSFTTLFRQARPAPTSWNVAKTFAQIVVFWGLLLFLVPHLLTRLELRLGTPSFGSPPLRIAVVLLFLCLSGLGLWSGVTVARVGRGTPLPLDSPLRLVVEGPYAYVRNPMAIAGLGQGVAVGLYLGSPLALLYVGVGAWMWQCLARPLEEADLLEHFGPEYEAYRRAVRCWWPSRTPFRARFPAPPV